MQESIIGPKIRQIRERKKITQEELAESTGNSVDLIKRIEEGTVVPSLTPLLQIARCLGIRLGTFVDDVEVKGPVLIKQGQTDQEISFSGRKDLTKESTLEFHPLASGKYDRHMEPFLIDVELPHTNDFELENHEGEEFIYVLDGSVELLYGDEKYIVNKGDSIYYDSVIPHHLHAYGDKAAKILAVIYTPRD